VLYVNIFLSFAFVETYSFRFTPSTDPFLMVSSPSVLHFIFLIRLYSIYFMTFQGLMPVTIKITVFLNVALCVSTESCQPGDLSFPLRRLASICNVTLH
jgi:hypothetical protein